MIDNVEFCDNNSKLHFFSCVTFLSKRPIYYICACVSIWRVYFQRITFQLYLVEYQRYRCGSTMHSGNIHRARSPVSISPYRCFPRRRSVSQVGISVHSSRPSAVTALGVTTAEMYGNCTRLTYRLRVARGLKVPSGSITGSTYTCRYQKGTRKETRPS